MIFFECPHMPAKRGVGYLYGFKGQGLFKAAEGLLFLARQEPGQTRVVSRPQFASSVRSPSGWSKRSQVPVLGSMLRATAPTAIRFKTGKKSLWQHKPNRRSLESFEATKAGRLTTHLSQARMEKSKKQP